MKNVIISASDPGGGNALLPLIDSLAKEFQLHIILGGASRELFKKAGIKFIDGEDLERDDLENLISDIKPELFFASTSFGYTVDKKILEILKGKIKTIYLLDFWSNYWKRFSSDNVKNFKYLPDVICVMDEFAKSEMIREGFDSKMVKITGNPSFDSFSKKPKTDIREKNRILFISQPYSDTNNVATNYGYTEYVVLRDLIEILKEFNNFKLIIRLHPKEDPKKFDVIIKENKNIYIDKDADTAVSIAKADIVIGMNSTAMLQAGMLKKQVISYQPNLRKSQDVLISNKMGLSTLITSYANFKRVISNYFKGRDVTIKNKAIYPKFKLIKNAKEKVIKLIKSYVKKG